MMEFEKYLSEFKNDVHKKMASLFQGREEENIRDIVDFMYSYKKFQPNTVEAAFPSLPNMVDKRCQAMRKQGDRCNRQIMEGCAFCSIHNGSHSGVGSGNSGASSTKSGNKKSLSSAHATKDNTTKKKEVFVQEIQGIMYYLDEDCNVYDTTDIVQNRPNPRIIAKAVCLSSNNYSIPSLGL